MLHSVCLLALALAEEQTRGILPEELVKSRPTVAAPAATKPKYQAVERPVASMRAPSSARQVGVTIWRLRPAAASDPGARILVQEEGNSTEWAPERVPANANLRQGDRVRLSIESPDSGYLYVIDRERYADGKRGEPYLIFPTTHTRNGENQVTAGKLIDLPGQEDRPNYFTLRQSRPDQAGEELTVLLTSQPIAGLVIGPKALALTEQQVSQWERDWGTGKTETFELAGGAGKTWTRAEQQAAASGTRLLTQDDPPPQTIYRVAAKPGEPVLVKVSLRYLKR
ncbi:MAG: DUF4384 domain-containing protein [Bryobacteraceae bacterium]|nr:DUF4384 domain-containing protein [Bryobacteraceae bacterium]